MLCLGKSEGSITRQLMGCVQLPCAHITGVACDDAPHPQLSITTGSCTMVTSEGEAATRDRLQHHTDELQQLMSACWLPRVLRAWYPMQLSLMLPTGYRDLPDGYSAGAGAVYGAQVLAEPFEAVQQAKAAAEAPEQAADRGGYRERLTRGGRVSAGGGALRAVHT